jgi:hypothetical protein
MVDRLQRGDVGVKRSLAILRVDRDLEQGGVWPVVFAPEDDVLDVVRFRRRELRAGDL